MRGVRRARGARGRGVGGSEAREEAMQLVLRNAWHAISPAQKESQTKCLLGGSGPFSPIYFWVPGQGQSISGPKGPGPQRLQPAQKEACPKRRKNRSLPKKRKNRKNEACPKEAMVLHIVPWGSNAPPGGGVPAPPDPPGPRASGPRGNNREWAGPGRPSRPGGIQGGPGGYASENLVE